MSLADHAARWAPWLRRGSSRRLPAASTAPADAVVPVNIAETTERHEPSGDVHPADPREETRRPRATKRSSRTIPVDDRRGRRAPVRAPARRRIAAEPPPATDPALDGLRDVRIMLVEDVPQVVERVRELLRSQDTIRLVAVVPDGRRVEDDVAEHRPDVILVDTLLQGRVKGPAVIERLRRTRNRLPCVAITLPDRPLPSGVSDGVDAVVSFPFGTFDLVRAIRNAAEAGTARNPRLTTRVVAIFSAKGGVGKTTIALNLAVALQQLGLRTALVDGSLQFADVRRLLHVGDDLPSIIDLPTDSVRSSDLTELMTAGPSGVEILLAPPRLEQAELITTRDLDKVVDMLRRIYGAVVIDTPSSLGETTLALLDAADVIIQVVTPETAALDITRLAAEAFTGIGYSQAKLQLLLNRADTQGSIGAGQIRRVFGRDPDYRISSAWALVAPSNAQGLAFVATSPEAIVSADVRGVAARVASIAGAAPRNSVVRRARCA